MKPKHVRIRVAQCLALSEASNCPRRKFGALLLDPTRNVILIDGYNGGPRDGGDLCGGDVCDRDRLKVPSGTQIEIGCHHAEMNVICNAAANGVRTRDAWLIVTGEPCLMCAKLIHHAGIVKVLVVKEGYAGANGCDYLTRHGVEVEAVDGPKDPRLGFDTALGRLAALCGPASTPSPAVDIPLTDEFTRELSSEFGDHGIIYHVEANLDWDIHDQLLSGTMMCGLVVTNSDSVDFYPRKHWQKATCPRCLEVCRATGDPSPAKETSP